MPKSIDQIEHFFSFKDQDSSFGSVGHFLDLFNKPKDQDYVDIGLMSPSAIRPIYIEYLYRQSLIIHGIVKLSLLSSGSIRDLEKWGDEGNG